MTANSLYPNFTRHNGGLAATFVQRRAICNSRSLEQTVERLHTGEWAASMSLNLVDLRDHKMVNVEAYLNDFSVYHVATNYSHMNMFQHLQSGRQVDRGDNGSTIQRRHRIWQLEAPKSVAEVATILGDAQDSNFPIYRHSTLLTLSLHDKKLEIWINTNPKTTVPAYVWNLDTFFDEKQKEIMSGAEEER